MNDADTVAAAYADAIKGLFKVLSSSYLMAAGDKQAEKHADDAFKAGLALARKVRDQALVLVR